MRNLKVCFIVTDAITFNMLYRDQLEYFRDHTSLDITLVCGGNNQHLQLLSNRKVGNIFNAKLVRKPSPFKDLKSLVLLISYFTSNRFDLVVYSTPKALLLGSLATLLTRHKNTIAIVRGRAYENYSGKKRCFYQILDKISLLNSKQVIFISKSLMNAYLQEKLVAQKKSFLLGSGSSNGVNTEKFRPSNTRDKRLPNDTKSFIVLIAGRICPDKGLYDLANVISLIKSENVIFRLVGPIEDKDSELFLDKLKQKHSNIEHIPYSKSIEDHFQQADLNLFLTHREGFGNVAVEAASCGVPTFAYNVIGVKDSVKQGVSGKKFNLGDTSSIAHAIDCAAKNPNFKAQYPSARLWVINNFSQNKVWERYLKFYENSISKCNGQNSG